MHRETKIFDPRDATTGSVGAELLDPTVVRRDGQWCMFLAGQAGGFGATDIYSATLPVGAPLSASGWIVKKDSSGALVPVADRRRSAPWDGRGGRHCPSYVKGLDPRTGKWVERIYYAGAAENLWGPYAIGYLEFDGEQWIDQSAPVFAAAEDWERYSVYEPNLVFHSGRWRMWYVAGSNQQDYLVHGYADSEDGVTGWSKHRQFAPADMKMFDFCVRSRGSGFEAVFSRVWVKEGPAPPETGLWWCRATQPSGKLSDWGDPIQIMTAEDRGWHSGPWKPSFEYSDHGSAHVFFDGMYRTDDPGPFPFAFTLGCAEVNLSDIAR